MVEKNKKGWIKIIEAFMAISMLLIVLFIVIGETNPREDYTSIIEKANLDTLNNLERNETFRAEILGLTPPSNELDFSITLNDYLDSKQLPSTNCTYQVCNPTSECLISKDFADETYSSEILIFSTKDNYDPKKFKIYCTRIS